MSEVNAEPLGDAVPDRPAANASRRWWDRFESLLVRLSERLNPILVKETRQALKSRQFAIVFSLLLLCSWGWSLLGVALLMPGVYYAAGGPFMLYGYFAILTAPLIVLIPFLAFRSFAAEWEDGTYELLSITTLKPRQIVGGKLGSAVLQMLVYLSALSPCIAFTYLLRGIDILLIGMILYYVFLTSLLLCGAGLLLATITREKHWQVMLSVGIVVGLSSLFVSGLGLAWELLEDNPAIPYQDSFFWVFQLVVLSVAASFFALFYLAAAARITIASENRSTRLRVVMLVQHLLLAGWFIYFWIDSRFANETLIVYVLWAACYWYVMGVLMTGESGELSPRARRDLPQSLVGRALLTWFNPGPGTGYFFAVANLLTAGIVALVAHAVVGNRTTTFGIFAFPTFRIAAAVVGTLCYLVIYLGLGRLLMILARRFVPAGIVLSVLIHILLLLLGIFGPLVIQLSLTDFVDDYTLLQISNPIWTIYELSVRSAAWTPSILIGMSNIPVALIILVAAALFMLVVQATIVATELREHVRIAPPKRVDEDEAELHPPPPPGPQSPWDDDAAG